MSANVRAEQLLQTLPEGNLVGAEIGVWRGLMSHLLLRRPGLVLYMVDNWKAVPGLEERGYGAEDQRANRFMAWKLTDFAHDRRIVLDMDSCDAAAFVPDSKLDFAFIDGDHSYEGVTRDIDAWLLKVKDGGWLCGHDYANPDDACGAEVKRAVDEFAGKSGRTVFGGEDHTWFVKV